MEQSQKQSFLYDLYSLHAGLALIAVEKDRYDAVGNKFTNEQDKVYSEYFRSLKPEVSLASEDGRRTYRESLTEHKNTKKERLKAQKRKNFISLLRFMLAIPFLGVSGLGVWLMVSVVVDFPKFGSFLLIQYLLIFVGIVAAGSGFVFAIGAIKSGFDESDFSLGYCLRCKREIKDTNADLAKIEYVGGKCLVLLQEANLKRQEIKESARKIYAVYSKLYSAVIDKRDWQYLDMIIFYLQTGRADTLKEALQQVDRYSQTEAIIKELANVTKTICDTVKTQIDRVVERLDTIIKQNDVIIDQNEYMSSQLELQTKLLDKMSQSSREIAVEVEVVVK